MDPFENLFGDIFSNQHRKNSKELSTEKEIRIDALKKNFSMLNEKDRPYLEKEVRAYKEEICSSGDTDLIMIYARASLFVGNIPATLYAYNHLLGSPVREEFLLKGLVALKKRDYNQAELCLNKIDSFQNREVILSFLDIQKGNVHPQFHKRLEAVVDNSWEANEILGISNFNIGNYYDAKKNFEKVIKIKENPSLKDKLNLMRTKVALGKLREVYSNMSKFYHDTNCALTPEQVQEELLKRDIDFPEFKLDSKRLYNLIY